MSKLLTEAMAIIAESPANPAETHEAFELTFDNGILLVAEAIHENAIALQAPLIEAGEDDRDEILENALLLNLEFDLVGQAALGLREDSIVLRSFLFPGPVEAEDLAHDLASFVGTASEIRSRLLDGFENNEGDADEETGEADVPKIEGQDPLMHGLRI